MLFNSRGRITQYFGVNKEHYERFNLEGHDGLDIVPTGDDLTIFSYTDGIVMDAYESSSYGNTIKVFSKSLNLTVRYAHLDSFLVEEGDHITIGMKIGIMGNTGNSSGSHLHTHIVPSVEYGVKLFPDNGYKGRCDPLPLLNSLSFL